MKNSYFISFLLSCLLVSISSTIIMACEFDRNWQRHDEPVLRSPIFDLLAFNYGYEAAGDPHAFQTTDGAWRMIYSADDDDQISIKLAERRSNGKWQEGPVLLGPSTGHTKPRSKETSFYRFSPTGEHQIYFIGYEDEKTYQSEIYLAVSEKLEGPYEIISEPVMPRGKIAGRDVYLITSPSVIDEGEKLTMTFLGWDGFEDVTEVWSFGATSIDNGRSWSEVQEVKVPIGMEGQITKTPDGRFAAVRTGEYGDGEAIFIACADNIFGPYTEQKEPILIQQGKPWEVDEIIAPALIYDRLSQQPVLFYTGADHSKGWWIMSAIPTNNGDGGNNNNEARIFSLAEQKFANLFAPANPTDQTAEGFLFRFYPTTNTYIGIKAGEVFVLGAPFGPDVLNVGTVPNILELLENR